MQVRHWRGHVLLLLLPKDLLPSRDAGRPDLPREARVTSPGSRATDSADGRECIAAGPAIPPSSESTELELPSSLPSSMVREARGRSAAIQPERAHSEASATWMDSIAPAPSGRGPATGSKRSAGPLRLRRSKKKPSRTPSSRGRNCHTRLARIAQSQKGSNFFQPPAYATCRKPRRRLGSAEAPCRMERQL